MRRVILLIFLLMSCSIFLFAQEGPEQGGFRHITVKDGLPSSEIYRIVQDRKGYMWMCTDAGVCRYNGFSFQNFTTREGLADNTVFRIKEANDGKIWVQSLSGSLSYYDGERFFACKANDSLKIIYSNGQRVSFCMEVEDDGGVVVGGLYTGACYRLLPSDNYSHLHKVNSPFNTHSVEREVWTNSEGAVFTFGMYDGVAGQGLFSHHGHELTITFPNAKGSATNNRSLLTKGNKLLYSYLNRLYVISEDGVVTFYDFAKTIIGIDEDKKGNIWVDLYFGGVQMVPGGDFTQDQRHLFGNKTVGCVYQDDEDGYWFSTVGEGVYYLPEIDFGYLTTYNGLPANTINCIAPYLKNKIIIGLPNSTLGILDTDKKEGEQFTSILVGIHKELSIEAVATKGDTIFVNSDENELLDSNLHLLLRYVQPAHEKGIVRNPINGKYFMYSHSDFLWCDRDFKTDSLQSVSIRFTTAAYDHDGTLWLGALNGLWKMGKSQPEYYSDTILFLQTRVDAITEDAKGNLWVATRGDGLYVRSTNQKWTHFTEGDGLSSNTCRTMITDQKNRIWVGTNKGITLISEFNAEKGSAEFRIFTTTSGLLSNEVRSLLIFHDKLWIGSNEGLSWVGIDKITLNPHAPPIYISSVTSGELAFGVNEVAEFNYGDAAIRVFLEGMSFRDPAGIRYKYRLNGGDEKWIVTSNRELTFSSLSPGNYSLEVFALNSDGIESLVPAKFAFIIHPPFWRTWWFILLSALIIGSVIWSIAVYRARNLRKRKEEKAQTEKRMAELRLSALRAQMNPHFIFNAINSIQHFVLENHSDQAYSYLSKFSRLIRLVLDQSRSDLVPIDQELDILKLYVELEKLRFERPFRFELKVDPWLTDNNVRIPGMLLQPFVENSIWHGLLPKQHGEAKVTVSMQRNGEYMEIMIEDNGVGRQRMKKTEAPGDYSGLEGRKSHGMKITEERISMSGINSTDSPAITITDLKDEKGSPIGTRIELKVHLEYSEDEND